MSQLITVPIHGPSIGGPPCLVPSCQKCVNATVMHCVHQQTFHGWALCFPPLSNYDIYGYLDRGKGIHGWSMNTPGNNVGNIDTVILWHLWVIQDCPWPSNWRTLVSLGESQSVLLYRGGNSLASLRGWFHCIFEWIKPALLLYAADANNLTWLLRCPVRRAFRSEFQMDHP